MSIDPAQFRAVIAMPVLTALVAMPAAIPYSKFAADLLLATGAQETRLGAYLVQLQGNAQTIYQFQPSSFAEFWPYARGQRWAAALLALNVGADWRWDQALDAAVGDLRMASLFARLWYYRVPAPLPMTTSLAALWGYYKPYWNSYAGAATEAEFQASVNAFTDLKL